MCECVCVCVCVWWGVSNRDEEDGYTLRNCHCQNDTSSHSVSDFFPHDSQYEPEERTCRGLVKRVTGSVVCCVAMKLYV